MANKAYFRLKYPIHKFKFAFINQHQYKEGLNIQDYNNTY